MPEPYKLYCLIFSEVNSTTNELNSELGQVTAYIKAAGKLVFLKGNPPILHVKIARALLRRWKQKNHVP